MIRSREISAHVIVQTQSQLKAVYKDHAETITGNCSCVLFLGSKEQSMLKEISALLGKETIDTFNTSDTRGSQRSYGLNYQKLEKELMTPNELAVMDGANVSCRCRVSVLSSRINLTSQNTRSTDTCQMQTQRMHLTWRDI